MPKQLTTVKNHISKHRAKYAVAATLIVVAAIDRARVKEWNGFLTEHNLLETYYQFDEA